MAVKRYNGTSWETYAGSFDLGVNQVQWKKTAAGGETTLSGSDDNSITLSYTAGQEAVYINGVLQVRNTDYTASNGTSVVLTSALIASDIVQVVSPIAYSIANTPTLAGNTFTADQVINGVRVGKSGSSSGGNTVFGYNALAAITTGYQNTAVGSNALPLNTTGNNNTAVGNYALGSNTTGYDNAAFGNVALQLNTTGRQNTAIGTLAMYANTIGRQNTAVGNQALQNNTTGVENVAVGSEALFSNTTGYYNTSVGQAALYSNTTGINNTGIGWHSLFANTVGTQNVAVGSYTLLNSNASFNVAVGYLALGSGNAGNGNVAIGSEYAGQFSAAAQYNTGSINIGIGAGSITAGSGNGNVAIGWGAMANITTGGTNTAIGAQSGNTGASFRITTGSNNTFLGNEATGSSSTVSNTITLGNSAITTLRCQVTSITALSDMRDKKNIETLPVGLDFVKSLKPVKFDWNMRQPDEPRLDLDGNPIVEGKIDVPDVGFIAQDLVELEDGTGLADYLQLTYRDNPDKLEATQGRLIPVLVKAIQELAEKVAELEAKVNN